MAAHNMLFTSYRANAAHTNNTHTQAHLVPIQAGVVCIIVLLLTPTTPTHAAVSIFCRAALHLATLLQGDGEDGVRAA